MTVTDAAVAYAREHREAILEDLKSLLRIPSISSHAMGTTPPMVQAAEWIAGQLRALGFEAVALLPTPRNPVVTGEWLKAGPSAPTLLVYGHYDVQPTDPLKLWTSDPFDPQVRGDNLYARGASDMKGQLVAHMKAMESLIRTTGLKVNLKFMIEGEEEIGSLDLEAFLRQHKDRFACDLCFNGDSGILAADIPSLTYGVRGLSYFEIRLTGPATDLHSGAYGGAVDNPAFVLCRLIAGMRDRRGRITIPGFYDGVRRISKAEREELARLPMDDSWWLERTGAPALSGEAGYTSSERAKARPTLDVNGFLSGFTEPGSKTVLPSKAMAKVSMRLVPDQTPAEVRRGLRAYLEANAPSTVTWELEELSSCSPAIVERDSEAVRAAIVALEAVWGKRPVFDRTGGSIPVVSMIQEILGVDSLLLGFGLPDDNLHAPNEKQNLPTLFKGIEATIHFLSEIRK